MKNAFVDDDLLGDAAELSAIFYQAARGVMLKTPPSAERTVALRHLMDSRNAALRALEGVKLPATLAELEA